MALFGEEAAKACEWVFSLGDFSSLPPPMPCYCHCTTATFDMLPAKVVRRANKYVKYYNLKFCTFTNYTWDSVGESI